jgi:hypothetical protein
MRSTAARLTIPPMRPASRNGNSLKKASAERGPSADCGSRGIWAARPHQAPSATSPPEARREGRRTRPSRVVSVQGDPRLHMRAGAALDVHVRNIRPRRPEQNGTVERSRTEDGNTLDSGDRDHAPAVIAITDSHGSPA